MSQESIANIELFLLQHLYISDLRYNAINLILSFNQCNIYGKIEMNHRMQTACLDVVESKTEINILTGASIGNLTN